MEVKTEKPNYNSYWELFSESQEAYYLLESLKTAESKGDKANYLDQLTDLAKSFNFPKLAEKAVIRRLKRRAK